MSNRPCFFALIALLAACDTTSKPCLDYVDAYEDCAAAAEAGGADLDVEPTEPKDFCALFPEVEDETWTCRAAAVRAADCSTNEGLSAMVDALDAC